MGIRRWIRNRRRNRINSAAAPDLRPEHIRHCQMMVHRNALLEQLPKHGIVAEVGVLFGDFSQEILERTEPRQLHLIDVRDRWGQRFSDRGDQVQSHIGDSCEMLAKFPDETFDWIYIDADHSYAAVQADAAMAKRKIKRDGWLVFNDYMVYDGVLDIPYGVAKTVNELCLAENWEITHFALQSASFYDVAIRRAEARRAA